MGKTLISGSISAGDYYNIMTGSVILENPDPVSYKLFYYQAGDVNANGTTQTLLRFGGKYWGEGSIVGIPIL